jgi:hypothetical protein
MTWVFQKGSFVAGPALAVASAAGCFVQDKLRLGVYYLIGGSEPSYVQRFYNGNWHIYSSLGDVSTLLPMKFTHA